MPILTMKNVEPKQLSRWKNDFFIYHKKFGIKENAIGEIYSYLGNRYKIIGINPSNYKKRIIAVEVNSKERIYKLSLDQIPKTLIENVDVAQKNHVIVNNKKEIERELKRLFNSIWKNKNYFTIATPDGKIIARYDKLSDIVRIHTENVQTIKKSR
jgi:hypothetical protein